MANLKSFKEVLETAIVKDTVKVITILDQELTFHTRQNVINRVNDLYANKINGAQTEMEFEDIPLSGEHNHKVPDDTLFTSDSTADLEDDFRFCACI